MFLLSARDPEAEDQRGCPSKPFHPELSVFPLFLGGGLVDPRVRASNEHLPSVRVPRAGGRPGCPRLPSRTGDAIPALLSAFSGMLVLHSDTSRRAAPLSSRSHGGTHLIVNHF